MNLQIESPVVVAISTAIALAVVAVHAFRNGQSINVSVLGGLLRGGTEKAHDRNCDETPKPPRRPSKAKPKLNGRTMGHSGTQIPSQAEAKPASVIETSEDQLEFLINLISK